MIRYKDRFVINELECYYFRKVITQEMGPMTISLEIKTRDGDLTKFNFDTESDLVSFMDKISSRCPLNKAENDLANAVEEAIEKGPEWGDKNEAGPELVLINEEGDKDWPNENF